MSTYTSSIGLEQITPGDQAGLWGNTTNNNLSLIDQAITGVTPISFTGLSSTVYTLTSFDGAVDEARASVLNITGIATGSNTVVVPNKQKTYLVRNATGQDVIFRTASPTATYTVGAGNSILIFCDGNNNVFTGIASPSVGTLGVSGGGTGSTTFTAGFVKSTGGTNALTSSSAVSLSADVSGVLPVANGGTGLNTITAGAILRGAGTAAPAAVTGTTGQVLTWTGSQWEAATPASGGVSSVFGRSGAVTAVSTDYSSFYPSLTGSGASGTWAINISGNAATATTATNVSGGTVSATTGTFSGRVSVGGGSAGSNFNLDVLGQANQTVAFFTTAGSSGNGIAINCTGGTTSAMLFNNSGSTTGQIVCTGSGTSYNTSSDRRLKENIVALTNSGTEIDALQPRQFVWKTTGQQSKGFIADELQQVVPEAVSGEPNAVDEKGNPIYQGIDCSTPEMIALLVAEIQSLRKRVAELEAK